MLNVQPFDKGLAQVIEKAIRDAGLGLNPASQGTVIRVPLPMLSEERAHLATPPYAGSLFVIDPLDGTKEFIAGRDEFTVNLAIVTDGVPLFGIVGAPALGSIWRGFVGRGAQRQAPAWRHLALDDERACQRHDDDSGDVRSDQQHERNGENHEPDTAPHVQCCP